MTTLGTNLYGTLLTTGLATPECPSKWTHTYLQKIKDRFETIADRNEDRVGGVMRARTMPDVDDLRIGSGTYFDQLSVLFLDICGFSCWSNWWQQEQANVLRVMNLFMASMLGVIRDFSGTCEKNTGDGLMAYFSEGPTPEEKARAAVEAAAVMFYVNDHVVTPELQRLGLSPVNFRVGIDTGPATIARVGVHSDANQFVAIGTIANVACKIMRHVEHGGICIGEHTFSKLSPSWQKACSPAGNTAFIYTQGGRPYPTWRVDHRLSTPFAWLPVLSGGFR